MHAGIDEWSLALHSELVHVHVSCYNASVRGAHACTSHYCNNMNLPEPGVCTHVVRCVPGIHVSQLHVYVLHWSRYDADSRLITIVGACNVRYDCQNARNLADLHARAHHMHIKYVANTQSFIFRYQQHVAC